MTFQTKPLPARPDEQAPDGSEIRLLAKNNMGDLLISFDDGIRSTGWSVRKTDTFEETLLATVDVDYARKGDAVVVARLCARQPAKIVLDNHNSFWSP